MSPIQGKRANAQRIEARGFRLLSEGNDAEAYTELQKAQAIYRGLQDRSSAFRVWLGIQIAYHALSGDLDALGEDDR